MSSTTVLFGTLNPPSGRWRPVSPKAGTCVGVLAIPLWATWPALALGALEIPALECLTIAFCFGWLVLARLQPATRNDQRASPLLSWLPGLAALGLTGRNAFHILATHHIPAAEANLSSYFWPVMIVSLGALLGRFKLRVRPGHRARLRARRCRDPHGRRHWRRVIAVAHRNRSGAAQRCFLGAVLRLSTQAERSPRSGAGAWLRDLSDSVRAAAPGA